MVVVVAVEATSWPSSSRCAEPVACACIAGLLWFMWLRSVWALGWMGRWEVRVTLPPWSCAVAAVCDFP